MLKGVGHMSSDHLPGSDLSSHPEAILSIQTLGRFSVTKNGHSLTAQTRNSKKIWNLFKYMLVNRETSQLPENILDRLAPELCSSHPANLLHVQVHRLRKILQEPSNAGNNTLILSNNGCYSWNHDYLCHIDIDTFVSRSKEAQGLQETSPHEAIRSYRQALSYYRGDFLPENSEEEWVIPHRVYYRHLFIEDVIQLCQLLLDQGNHQQAAQVCEQAIILEPFEETFHLILMESLLFNRRVTEALQHYNYITGLYYRDLGISPTQNLKNTYQKIMEMCSLDQWEKSQYSAKDSKRPDLTAQWKTRLEFRSLAIKDKKRCRKEGLVFSIYQFTCQPLPEGKAASQGLMLFLQHFLRSHLRRHDVLTQWTPGSIAGLLPFLEDCDTSHMLNRLVDAFEKVPGHKGHTLSINVYHDLEELQD